MKGLMAVTDFRELWDGTDNFKVMSAGHLFFSANIIYTSAKRGEEHSINSVQIIRNGVGDGNVNIADGDELDSETHHLGLNYKFQNYSLDPSDNSLLIEGSSPKMGGKYSIKILPNGLPASWA